jgi:tRNA1Val (adenine37-N6)-methyltransferase
VTGVISIARRPPDFVAPGPLPPGARGAADLAPADDETLSYLCGDWRLFQKRRGHRWSLDDLVTAWVAAPLGEAAGAREVLDLGCGQGSVLLLLAWRLPQSRVIGVEAQAERAALARRSIRYDGVEDRCEVREGDLRDPSVLPPELRVPLVTGTPPYFPRGTGSESAAPHALPCRFEVRGGVEAYLEAAARWLSPQGVVVLCSAALERARVDPGARAAGLVRRDRLEVVPREGKAPLVLVDTFGRAPGPSSERTLVVRDRALQWTPEFRAVRSAFGMPVHGAAAP